MAKPRQLPSGNWNVQTYLGKDKNGKIIKDSRTFATEEEALLYAANKKKTSKTTGREYEQLFRDLIGNKSNRGRQGKTPLLPSEQIKKSIKQHITKDIKKELEKIDQMDGDVFEEYCATLFRLSGYFYGGNVVTTPYHNDYGADLIITCFGGFKVAVQCKRVSSTARLDSVQEVIASMAQYGAHAACVITNRFFAPNAMELAKNANVALIDRYGLIKLIEMKNQAMKRIQNQWFALLEDLYTDNTNEEEQ